MPLSTLVILALIQGITEFLPVSSSGHLILLPQLTGGQDQGLALDVAVHLGTLFAVVLFFWKDVLNLILGGLDVLRARFSTPNARLAILMIIATIPVIIAGFILKALDLDQAMRDIRVIGWAMLVFGLILYWYDTKSPATRDASDWQLKDAIVMGFWQALALIPGTSRSGATITAARQLGFTRKEGAKIAMLMSIPTILASATLIGLDVMTAEDPMIMRDLAVAAVLSFIAALFALFFMMKLLNAVSFTPYVIYRVILGVVLLWIAYT